MQPHAAKDYAWVATRSKALLTAKDRTLLTEMRAVYNDDAHIVAAVDVLLVQ